MDELKPCPFCSGTDLNVHERDENPAGESWVTCLSCGASSETKNSETDAIAAWNTRAQPKPEVAPDDEALIDAFGKDAAQFGNAIWSADKREATKRSREALRRRIAELRATSLKYQLAFGDRDNDAHRLADRVAELKAALAACRSMLEKACHSTSCPATHSAIEEFLRTKEPTNG